MKMELVMARRMALAGLFAVAAALPVSAGSLLPQPMVAFSGAAASEAEDPRGGADAVDFEQSDLAGGLPLPSTDMGDTRVGGRVQARRSVLSFDYTDEERLALYEVAVPLTLDHRYTEAWSARAVVSPALAGDFESLDAKSIRGSITGMGIHTWPETGTTLAAGLIFLPALGDSQVLPMAHVTWVQSPQLTLSAGVTYVPDAGEDRLSPTFSVGLRPSDSLELMLSYPRSWIAYAASPAVTLYADVAPAGGRWRVADAPGAEDGGVISLRGFRSGAGAGWALGPIRLITEAGALWNREYEAEPTDGTDVTAEIDNAWYAMIGMTL